MTGGTVPNSGPDSERLCAGSRRAVKKGFASAIRRWQIHVNVLPAMPINKTSSPPSAEPVNQWLVARHSPVHGRGLFAARLIPAGTRLLEYFGEHITKAESLRRCAAGNVYIIGLDADTDLDGDVADNHARFINHSCAPNCEMVLEEEVTLTLGEQPAARGELNCSGVAMAYRVFIDALRAIPPGEEVAFNYGYDLVDYRDHPCSCGSPKCVGFIVAEVFFPTLRRKHAPAPSPNSGRRTT
jgi:hypothetical protein